ncbi:hypothetical protein FQA39_LY09868 [Lamprigera yunnana]|nr:hypothetical protein FQA39_LY09868 [Lamprigera yunnana]
MPRFNSTSGTSRQPLGEIAVNFENKNLTKGRTSNINSTTQDEGNNRVVVSGYISKVTENKLKTKHLIKSVSASTSESKTNLNIAEHRGTNSKLSITTRNSIKRVQKLLHGKLTSPIKSSIHLPFNTVIFQGIPKDVKKASKKTTLSRKGRSKNRDAYSIDIYCTDYLEDIIQYQLTNDYKFVLPDSVKSHKTQIRAETMQWLMKVHVYLEQPATVLFTTVHLFDFILGSIDVPINVHQLVSFVTMWIIIKFESTTNFPLVTKLSTLCNQAYSISEILRMEKKLLKFFGFDFNVSDVILYTNFYIKELGDCPDLLCNCAQYILECFILNKKIFDYFTIETSSSCSLLNIKYLTTKFNIMANSL